MPTPEYLRFSIVTISLNSADFIEDTIRSVLDQDYPDVEHIIVDGGSTDGTLDILAGYPHLRWHSEADGGRADAFNKGLALMTGSVHGCLNADDVYAPNTLQLCNAALQENPDVDLVYGDGTYISASGDTVGTCTSGPYDVRRMIVSGSSPIPHPSVFLRKRVFASVGVMDTSLQYAYDLDMWIRIGVAGCRVKYVPKPMGCFRLHSGSVTTSDPNAPHVTEGERVGDRYWSGSRYELALRRRYWRLRRWLYVRLSRQRMLDRAMASGNGRALPRGQ